MKFCENCARLKADLDEIGEKDMIVYKCSLCGGKVLKTEYLGDEETPPQKIYTCTSCGARKIKANLIETVIDMGDNYTDGKLRNTNRSS
jgi:DNA-directed RNA polymerase subunit RPC12/RpoP